LKSERNFRNYLAGAALAFGFVLLAEQITWFASKGLNQQQLESIISLISGTYIISHVFGSFVGSYLVARRKRADYIFTGTVVAVLAYVFEFIYNIIVTETSTSIWALLSLILGGVSGAIIFGIRSERNRIPN
jgi:hypothetical protein